LFPHVINVSKGTLMSLTRLFQVFSLAAGLSAAFAGRPASLDAQPESLQIERAKQLVVMVNATFEDSPDGETRFGAGVVVGAGMSRVYIVTANHLVRRGERVAGAVDIRFRGLPGEVFTGRVLSYHDPSLDYAVLMVDNREANAIIPRLPFRILRGTPIAPRVPVFHVGQPNGSEWGVNVTPAAIARVNGSTLRFQSTSLVAGYSGGGLFDGDGALVGLVTGDGPVDAEAIRIDHLVASLRDDGIQVSLAMGSDSPPSSTAPAERQARIGPLTIEMTICTRVGTQLHCHMFLSTTVSGRFGITTSSEALDENGNTFRPVELRIGNQTHPYRLDPTLAAGVRTPAVVIFSDVPPTRELALVRLSARFENHDWRMVPFPHVPVQSTQ
jgi:hypothetical protein